ncbi:MAG TPA: TlpA disulfide reductase family protein [Catenuloplanes sp.]|jgi:thiol-disulfide isomerase/thioredoxin
MNRIGLILVSLLVLATGCTDPATAPDRSAPPPPFGDCAALTVPPPAAPPGAVPGDPPPDAVPRDAALPDVELPCMTGGGAVRATGLRGPAVVNLWASWCPPCRKELPAVQRFAARATGTVHVVGVVTHDDRDAAATLATELGISFPTLEDREEKVRKGVRGPGLPVTVLIDRSGRIRLVQLKPVDDATLRGLVERHLGVRVPA